MNKIPLAALGKLFLVIGMCLTIGFRDGIIGSPPSMEELFFRHEHDSIKKWVREGGLEELMHGNKEPDELRDIHDLFVPMHLISPDFSAKAPPNATGYNARDGQWRVDMKSAKISPDWGVPFHFTLGDLGAPITIKIPKKHLDAQNLELGTGQGQFQPNQIIDLTKLPRTEIAGQQDAHSRLFYAMSEAQRTAVDKHFKQWQIAQSALERQQKARASLKRPPVAGGPLPPDQALAIRQAAKEAEAQRMIDDLNTRSDTAEATRENLTPEELAEAEKIADDTAKKAMAEDAADGKVNDDMPKGFLSQTWQSVKDTTARLAGKGIVYGGAAIGLGTAAYYGTLWGWEKYKEWKRSKAQPRIRP